RRPAPPRSRCGCEAARAGCRSPRRGAAGGRRPQRRRSPRTHVYLTPDGPGSQRPPRLAVLDLSAKLVHVKLLAALVLPALLALGFAYLGVRLVGGALPSSQPRATGVVWGDHTFANRAALGRWLRSRG